MIGPDLRKKQSRSPLSRMAKNRIDKYENSPYSSKNKSKSIINNKENIEKTNEIAKNSQIIKEFIQI